MKKIIIIILYVLLLTGCSIDWNNEKTKNIEELNNKIESLEKELSDLKISNNIELQRLEFEKQKYEEEKEQEQINRSDKYKKECHESYEKLMDKFVDILNTCKTNDCQQNLLNGKMNPQNYGYDYIGNCVTKKESGLWRGD